MRLVGAAAMILSWALAAPAAAHPLSFGTLEVREQSSGRVRVVLRYSGSEARPTGVEPLLPRRCAPARPARTTALTTGVEIDRLEVCPEGLRGETVGVRGIEEAGVQVAMRLTLQDGQRISAVLDAAAPTLVVPAVGVPAPATVPRYLRLGAEHILEGLDHLLFVLGLTLLVRRLRDLLVTVSAFTIGHSVTLALATLGLASAPPAATEAVIALSIVLLAVELSRGRDGPETLTQRAPWLVACAFGLLHGFGFAGALADVGVPADDVPGALLGFNLGVELGQIAFVLAVVASLLALGRARAAWEDRARRALPYVMGALGAFFCIERIAAF